MENTFTPCLKKKLCQCYFLNNSAKHARNITKKIDVNDCSFAHLTLIPLLHYLVKSRSRSLAVYNNEFILGSACVAVWFAIWLWGNDGVPKELRTCFE